MHASTNTCNKRNICSVQVLVPIIVILVFLTSALVIAILYTGLRRIRYNCTCVELWDVWNARCCSKMKLLENSIYHNIFCFTYSQTTIAPATWTFSDLNSPNWGISTQASKNGKRCGGMPSFSFLKSKCISIDNAIYDEKYRYGFPKFLWMHF